MRMCQAMKIPAPEYVLSGKMNDQFFITVHIDGMPCASGFATTKKQAEQNASEMLLKTDARFKNKELLNGGRAPKSERAPQPNIS